jgi:hypothetical protein
MAAFGFGYSTLNNGNQFWSVQPYDPRVFGRSAFWWSRHSGKADVAASIASWMNSAGALRQTRRRTFS